jgi:hypothetical protein
MPAPLAILIQTLIERSYPAVPTVGAVRSVKQDRRKAIFGIKGLPKVTYFSFGDFSGRSSK